MKAEHRKELETNILADSVGRMMQRMKERPQKRTFLYVIGGFILFFALFVIFRLYRSGQQQDSFAWIALERGKITDIADIGFDEKTPVIRGNPDAPNFTKAARFQLAWYFLWEEGIRKLGGDSLGALDSVHNAAKIYNTLATDCAGDPAWESEALYSLAVIEETLAVQERDHLEKAQRQFKDLAKKYPDTGYGKLADQRARYIESNIAELRLFYQNLQEKLHVPPAKLPIP